MWATLGLFPEPVWGQRIMCLLQQVTPVSGPWGPAPPGPSLPWAPRSLGLSPSQCPLAHGEPQAHAMPQHSLWHPAGSQGCLKKKQGKLRFPFSISHRRQRWSGDPTCPHAVVGLPVPVGPWAHLLLLLSPCEDIPEYNLTIIWTQPDKNQRLLGLGISNYAHCLGAPNLAQMVPGLIHKGSFSHFWDGIFY